MKNLEVKDRQVLIAIIISALTVYLIAFYVYPTQLYRGAWTYSDVFATRWTVSNGYPSAPSESEHPFLYSTFGKAINLLEETPGIVFLFAVISQSLQSDIVQIHSFFPLGQLFLLLAAYLIGVSLFDREPHARRLLVLASVAPIGPVYFRVGLNILWEPIGTLMYSVIFYLLCQSCKGKDLKFLLPAIPIMVFLRVFYISTSAIISLGLIGIGSVQVVLTRLRKVDVIHWETGTYLATLGLAVFITTLTFPSVVPLIPKIASVFEVPEYSVLSETLYTRVFNLVFFAPLVFFAAQMTLSVFFRKTEKNVRSLQSRGTSMDAPLMLSLAAYGMVFMLTPSVVRLFLVGRGFLHSQLFAAAAWVLLLERIQIKRSNVKMSTEKVRRVLYALLVIGCLISIVQLRDLPDTRYWTSNNPGVIEGLKYVKEISNETVVFSDLKVAGILLSYGHEQTIKPPSDTHNSVFSVFYSLNATMAFQDLRRLGAQYLVLTSEMALYGIYVQDYLLRPISSSTFDYYSSDERFALAYSNGDVYFWSIAGDSG